MYQVDEAVWRGDRSVMGKLKERIKCWWRGAHHGATFVIDVSKNDECLTLAYQRICTKCQRPLTSIMLSHDTLTPLFKKINRS